MPSNRFNAHTDYGIGIGLRIPHYQNIFDKKPVVDWFGIISENFMVDGGRPLANLDQILERYRVGVFQMCVKTPGRTGKAVLPPRPAFSR